MQSKYASEANTAEEENDPLKNKFMILRLQSGNSMSMTTMPEHGERSQWHVVATNCCVVYSIVPPLRPTPQTAATPGGENGCAAFARGRPARRQLTIQNDHR